AGKFQLDLEDVDIPQVVSECAQTLTERARSAGVTLNVSLPAGELMCMADLRAVKQIVLNLLSNAIKFTPGGHVDTIVTSSGDRVSIAIRDDGVGIAAEELPRLGRPFEQVCKDPKLAKS